MHFSEAFLAILAVAPLASAAPAPYSSVHKRWVDTNGGFSGSKMPAHFVTSVRSAAKDKIMRKRQLDQILGQLTGGAGGGKGNAAAGGAANPLAGLLGKAGGAGGAGGAAGAAGAAGGAGDLLGGILGKGYYDQCTYMDR